MGPRRALRIGITCYPTTGGSGIIATEIGRALAQRGHKVHFICYELPGRLDPQPSGITFHRVRVREYPLPHLDTYVLALASQLAEVSTAAELDLLHLHYAIPHTTSGYLAVQLLRDRGQTPPRLITTLHGTDVTQVGSDPALLPMHRFTLRHSDGLTVPSAYLRQAVYDDLGLPSTTPIEVIANFVDTELFRPADRGQRRWDELGRVLDQPLTRLLQPAGGVPRRRPTGRGRGPAPRVLIHSSNFRPLKRIDDVLRVFCEVQKVVPAILLLVGDGPERPRIEALTRELELTESVYFLGLQRDFLTALRHSEVFLLASTTEGFGLSALEALSCGIPVVGSRVGGVPEVVRDGQTGLLCDAGDIAAMTRAVLRLLQDRALHRQMSRAARASVQAFWRKDPMVSLYEDFYHRVLGQKSRA
jgi:glycosyltransferase involved in cell wall biosynthesis